MIEEKLILPVQPARGMVITDFDGTIHSKETGVTEKDFYTRRN